MINSKMIFLFAIKMFLVSILEETFFRGYLFTNFYDGFKSNKTSKKQAILISLIISSVLFGLAHFNTSSASVVSLVMLTINGIVWCIPFVITKNLKRSFFIFPLLPLYQEGLFLLRKFSHLLRFELKYWNCLTEG